MAGMEGRHCYAKGGGRRTGACNERRKREERRECGKVLEYNRNDSFGHRDYDNIIKGSAQNCKEGQEGNVISRETALPNLPVWADPET